MKILGIVDIHSKLDQLDDILAYAEDVDIVLLAGDITNFGRAEKAEEVLGPLSEAARTILAVTGNCDYAEVDEYLRGRGCQLEGAPREVSGVGILGVGGSLPCPTPTAHEHTEEEFRELLAAQSQQFAKDLPKIAVIHQPPVQTKVDKSLLAGHVGSQAVRNFIEIEKPLLCFSGHIHESRAIDSIGPTTLVNPGPFLKGYFFLGELADGKVEIELRQL